MSNYVELPLEEGKELIANTAMSLGYEEDLANLLAYSAWWLENRSLHGVTQACVYMLLTRDIEYRDRKAIKLPDGGLRIRSPMWGGNLFWKLMDDGDLIDTSLAIYGPVSPLLMIPMIVHEAANLDKAVRMSFNGLQMVFAKTGTWITNADEKGDVDITIMSLLDADAKRATSIQLIELNEMNQESRYTHYNRLDKLRFPKIRVRGDKTLYLGD